jgi:dihydroorotase/N-acyl-D-amino-acid deacylase
MTGQPARRLGLKDRGVIAAGAYADVTVFDPATVLDKSTFQAPHQYPDGIPYVVINGRLAFENGVYHDVRAGRVVRGPGFGTADNSSVSYSGK